MVLPLIAGLVVGSGLRGERAAKVDLTFAFFGCNRIDAKDYDAAENPSSANLPQLAQNLKDGAKLAPDYFFFGGDLVLGYADDQGQVLNDQMSAWVKAVAAMPKAKTTQYVVMPGNHESNRKAREMKLPNPVTDSVWAKLVKAHGLIPADAKGPTPASSPEDHLVGDQGALNFSFDRGSVHFVVLNTDTRVTDMDAASGETKIAMIPTHWLDADLTKAEKNPRIKQVIVMGHRNLIDPATAKGDAPIDAACVPGMTKALISHKKVRAYVCAHVHAFDITAINGSGVLQTCFGNGGSKLETGWKPAAGRTFGFGYFKAYANGSLGVVPYLRPEPKNYMSTAVADVPAAKPQSELVIPVRK